MLRYSHHCEIWQALGSGVVIEKLEKLNHRSCAFETFRDLMVRHILRYWIAPWWWLGLLLSRKSSCCLFLAVLSYRTITSLALLWHYGESGTNGQQNHIMSCRIWITERLSSNDVSCRADYTTLFANTVFSTAQIVQIVPIHYVSRAKCSMHFKLWTFWPI